MQNIKCNSCIFLYFDLCSYQQKFFAVLITCVNTIMPLFYFQKMVIGLQEHLALALTLRCSCARGSLLFSSPKSIKWNNQSGWQLVLTNMRVWDCAVWTHSWEGRRDRWVTLQSFPSPVSGWGGESLSCKTVQCVFFPELPAAICQHKQMEAFSCPKPTGMQAQAAALPWQSHSLFSDSPVLWNMRKRRVLCFCSAGAYA